MSSNLTPTATVLKKPLIFLSFLFVFVPPVYAGACIAPKDVIYVSESEKDKYLPCSNLISRFGLTERPLLRTTSFKKDIITDENSSCSEKDTSSLETLSLADFSLVDQIKLMFNLLLVFILFALPLGLFLLIYRRLESSFIRASFDILSILGFLFWVGFLLIRLGFCPWLP